MKKSYSKLVMAAALAGACGLAVNAQAVVNLDNGTGINTYANEIAGAVPFSDIIEAEAGAVLPIAAVPYIKFTCSTALTTASPDLGSVDVSTPPPAMTTTNALVSGGMGVTSATYSSTIAGDALAKKDLYQWGNGAGPAPVQMAITSGASVSCTYNLYETANHWSQGNPAVTTSNTVVKWADGLLTRAADMTCASVTGCNSANYATIDLTTDGKKFTNNRLTGRVASINLNARTGDGILDASTPPVPVTWAAMIDAT